MAKLDLASTLKASVAPTPVATEESSPPAPKLVAVPAPPPEADEPVTAEEDAAAEVAVPATKATGTRKPRKQGQPRSQPAPAVDTEPASVGVALELPADLDKRLTAYRAKTRKSHPTVLLDAVEATYEQLPDLIRISLGRDEETPKTVLFGRAPRTPAPIQMGESGDKVRHSVRVTLSNRNQLDELTVQFGAPSRNFLIVTAYEAYLPQL